MRNTKYLWMLCTAFIYGCYDCEQSMNELKIQLLSCIVDTVYDNPENRHSPTVLLTCEKSYSKLYFTKFEFPVLYNFGARGDKVEKDSISLEFRLIKKDTVITFYPFCNGKQLRN